MTFALPTQPVDAQGDPTLEEDMTDKRNGSAKRRAVNTEAFAPVMLEMATMAMPNRKPKTKVDAIVESVFELAEQCPGQT